MNVVSDPGVDLAATPTPIQRLESLSDNYPGELYVKRDDDTAGVAQGNKIRKLEYLLGDAIDEGADTVITAGGLQSNHCRATAVCARRLGLDPYLLLHGDEPDVFDGNLLLDKLAGAEVEYITESTYRKHRGEKFEAVEETLREAGRIPYSVPVGGSDPIGIQGYVRAYEEIAEYVTETGNEFDRIFCAAGSGGTQAGLLAGAMAADHETDIVGVNITESAVDEIAAEIMANIEGLPEVADVTPFDLDTVRDRITVLPDYVGPGYAQVTDADVETIVEAGRTEGLILDTSYTGKAFRAFLEESEAGERNLFVHTGGSYGLFPNREQLTAAISR